MARSTSVDLLAVHETTSLGSQHSGTGLPVANNERQIAHDEALCDKLMTLRGRVFEGTLTRGQLRAHVMQFSGHTRIVMEDVPDLARVFADDAVPSTPVHAGEYELLLGCLRSHFDTYKGFSSATASLRIRLIHRTANALYCFRRRSSTVPASVLSVAVVDRPLL